MEGRVFRGGTGTRWVVFPSAKALVVVGAVAGVIYGLVTWPLLARLRRLVPAR